MTPDPLHIVQLCTRYPPASGGVETHVHAISTELARRGHEVEVLTSDLLSETPFERLDPDRGDFGEVDGVRVRRFRARSLSGDVQYSIMPSMMKEVMGSGADIVHAHSYGFFQTHLGMMARKMGDSRFVLTPHFHPEWASGKSDTRRLFRRIYDRTIGERTLASADALLCVSEGEADALRQMGIDDDSLHIVPNGITPELLEIRPDPSLFREAYGVDPPMVLFAGRLAENKGLTDLVRAAPRVAEEVPDVSFVLVGRDGGMARKVEEAVASAGLEDRFTLTGHLEDERTYRSAFAASDVFVLPSIFEAFGIVVLEAMALGRPCVATRVGGIPHLVEDGRTGLLVEPGDPGSLAAALVELLKDGSRARGMGDLARDRVGEGFTWPRIVDRLEAIYRALLGSA